MIELKKLVRAELFVAQLIKTIAMAAAASNTNAYSAVVWPVSSRNLFNVPSVPRRRARVLCLKNCEEVWGSDGEVR